MDVSARKIGEEKTQRRREEEEENILRQQKCFSRHVSNTSPTYVENTADTIFCL